MKYKNKTEQNRMGQNSTLAKPLEQPLATALAASLPLIAAHTITAQLAHPM